MATLGVDRFSLAGNLIFVSPHTGLLAELNTQTGEITTARIERSGLVHAASLADCVPEILIRLGVEGVEYQPGKRLFSLGGRAIAVDADGGWVKPVTIREGPAIEP